MRHHIQRGPLLRRDILTILGMCEDLDLQVGVITNGTLLTHELCKELSRTRKVFVQSRLHRTTEPQCPAS